MSRPKQTPSEARLAEAKRQTALAEARLAGMKIRAQLHPPTAATGGFPYPARTCADWVPGELPPELDDDARLDDAANGSRMLFDAIVRLAA